MPCKERIRKDDDDDDDHAVCALSHRACLLWNPFPFLATAREEDEQRSIIIGTVKNGFKFNEVPGNFQLPWTLLVSKLSCFPGIRLRIIVSNCVSISRHCMHQDWGANDEIVGYRNLHYVFQKCSHLHGACVKFIPKTLNDLHVLINLWAGDSVLPSSLLPQNKWLKSTSLLKLGNKEFILNLFFSFR